MKTITCILITLLILIAASSFEQAGSLDSSFGTNGKIKRNFGVTGLAVQADGKIIVTGGGFSLIRFNNNGSVDSSFGVNGVVNTSFGSTQVTAVGVAVQKDGKIIVAGSAEKWNGYTEVYGFALARYKNNGSLDYSFGNKGKVTSISESVDYIHAQALALQADGKILVAGNNTSEYFSHFFITRYNTDGSGDGGVGESNFSAFDLASSIALQSNQKIIVTGSTYKNPNYHFLLARFKTDGSVDTTFANQGKNINGLEKGIAVIVLNDDKIAVLTDGYFLRQFSKRGKADTLFGENGKVSVPFNAAAIAVQLNDKIIVAGTKDSNFAVARYTTSGKLDKSFGVNGIAKANFGGNDKAYAVAIWQDKIVTAGSSDNKLAVARFNGGSKTALITRDVINTADDATKQALSVKIYPNPVQSILNIEFSKNILKARINIYDINGKLLPTKAIDGNTQIDVRQLTAGTYLMKINDESGKLLYSGKVVKQ